MKRGRKLSVAFKDQYRICIVSSIGTLWGVCVLTMISYNVYEWEIIYHEIGPEIWVI